MRLILTALVFLGGLFFILLGLAYLFQPAETAAGFGIAATDGMGKAAIRADMTALFCVTGITMMWGAWKRSGDILLVPALIMGIAMIGRLADAATAGTYDGYLPPILIEGAVFVLLMFSRSVLPHHTIDHVGE
ncbi:MAG: hypothetical protein KDE63_03390 [Novosphingobium sp.]|nr:hypothetical protein [Novosphingobium sp.]